MRQNEMGGVARSTVGCNCQALFQEAFSMDAFGVVLENMRLGNLAFALDARSFLVTFSADERDLQRRDRRSGVAYFLYIMFAVTILAIGGENVAARKGLPVKTLPMELLLTIVARSALNGGDRNVMRQFLSLETRVTGHTGDVSMH